MDRRDFIKSMAVAYMMVNGVKLTDAQAEDKLKDAFEVEYGRFLYPHNTFMGALPGCVESGTPYVGDVLIDEKEDLYYVAATDDKEKRGWVIKVTVPVGAPPEGDMIYSCCALADKK